MASVYTESGAVHAVRALRSWSGFRLRVDFEATAAPGRHIFIVARVYDRKGNALFETSADRAADGRPCRDTCDLDIPDRALRQGLPAGQHYVTYTVALLTRGGDGTDTELARTPPGVWSVSFRH